MWCAELVSSGLREFAFSCRANYPNYCYSIGIAFSFQLLTLTCYYSIARQSIRINPRTENKKASSLQYVGGWELLHSTVRGAYYNYSTASQLLYSSSHLSAYQQSSGFVLLCWFLCRVFHPWCYDSIDRLQLHLAFQPSNWCQLEMVFQQATDSFETHR